MRQASVLPAGQVSPDDTLRALVAALGNRRPIEPRVVGGFPHAACVHGKADPEDLIPLARCSPPPSPGTEAFDELSAAGRALLSPSPEAETGPLLHARGIWHLIWLDDEEGVDRAVHDLETAATLASADDLRSAAAFSDLSAAYLVRAAVKDQPLDLILALDASGKALEREPALAEALFNHALSIEALHLRTEARTAWEDVLNVEPTGPWADEARDHLRHLEEPTVLEAWEVQRPLLERAARRGDTEEVDRLVAAFGAPVRDWIEEDLLPAWGQAELAGEATEAAETLTVARTVADPLARLVGEHMPADAIAAIDRGDGPERRQLAEGHQAFGEGMERYKAHDCSGATERFADAETQLGSEGSPFATRATLQREICSYYRTPEATWQALADLQTKLEPHRYPTLEGRIAWTMAICQGDQGNWSPVLASYQSGIDAFRRIADPDAGSLLGYRANAEEALGQSRQAWTSRLAALEILARHADPKRLYNLLYGTVRSLLDENRPDLAVHFQGELLVQARTWGEPGPLADGYLTRSRILLALGDDQGALEDLHSAERLSGTMPEGEIKDRLVADMDAALGQALARTEPARALELLSSSIDRYRAIGHVLRVPDFLVNRARAALSLDDVAASRDDLTEAIREQEERRRETPAAQDRIGLLSHAREAYDALVALELDRGHDPFRSLRWSDRARGQEVRRAHARLADLPAERSALLRLVPDGVTAVEYAVLPDRVIFWIVGRELHTVVRDLPETALDHEVNALRALIEARAPESEIRGHSAPLFEALLRPVVEQAGAGGTLVLVPDRSLHRLPFAALWDARSDSYLAESHPLAVAPSLGLALGGPPQRARAGKPSTILAVGASIFDRHRFPELPPLPRATREAQAVSALYSRPELLLSEQATPDAFRKLAGQSSVVHIAGHALADPLHPERSALLLAPSSDDPRASTISAEQLSRLPLEGVDLVYLSACRTVSDLPAGSRSEGAAGLARAALVAGARAVIANRWEVDDAVALTVAIAFHRRFARGASPVMALNAAQRALLADPTSFTHHPAAWSGFSVQIAAPSLLVPTEPSIRTVRSPS